jgi:hypothetical protein
MSDKQQKARDFITADLEEAINAVDDIDKLRPHAAITSPKLDAKLREARAALTAALAIVKDPA